MIRMRCRPPAPRRRRGGLLVEMVVGTFLVAAAIGLGLHLLAWTAAERLAAERRDRALHEAANALERLAARPWAELTPEAADAVALDPGALAMLPGAELEAEVGPGPDPDSKRLAVTVRWRDRAGNPGAPAKLVGFVHRREDPE